MRIEPRKIGVPASTGWRVRLAETAGEVCDAQRLRHAVFGEEMGARLRGAPPGLDRDRFDTFCDHLSVCEPAGRVVGTYRILPPAQRGRAGGWYCCGRVRCDRAASLRRSDGGGRPRVRGAAYRSGRTIALLWTGLLRYVLERGRRYLIGCVSIGTEDGGHIAASLCRHLLQEHLAAPPWRVVPRSAFAVEGWREVPDPPLPPLLKGYLRLAAQVCGPPAWDGDFNTADLLMVLSLADITPRYVHRLLRTA